MPSTRRPLRSLRRALLALGVFMFACGALLAMPRDQVLAHASLLAADPAEDIVVPLPPNRVTLSFAEPLEVRLSSIEVTTTDGKRVDRDDLTLADGGRRATVTVAPLERGTYIVGWKNVSTVDGHPLAGRYAFHVGARSTDATITSTAPTFASALEPPARFILDAGLLTLVGSLCVIAFVMTREARTVPALRLLALGAAVVALAGGALQLVAQVSATGGSPVDVLQGRWGTGYLVRMVAALLAAALVWSRRPRLALAAAGIALASIAVTSHAAAVRGLETPAIIADALHIAAVAVWVGGLPAIALVVWAQRGDQRERGEALRRFSTLALIAAAVAGLTGTYLAWLHVLRLSAFDTVYGRGVLLKFALFGGLLVLGAVNRKWSLPALARGVHRRIRRTIAIEVALAIGLVAAVAVMTSTLPGREILRAPLPGGLVTTPEGVRIDIRVRPALPGSNEVTVDVRDSRGRAVEGAAVAVRAAPVGQEPDVALPAQPDGPGRYRVSAVLGARGIWTVYASVAPPEGFDQNAAVRAEIGGAPAPRPTPSIGLGWKGLGWVLVLGGAFAAAVADREWPWRSRRRSPWYGATAAAAGLVVLILVAPHFTVPTSLPDATPETLARGQTLYEANCARCHGANFVPQEGVADLRAHVPVHGDVYLLEVVRNGRPGTAMPPFRETLSEDEIGAVLTYVQEQATLLAAAASSAPPLPTPAR